MTVWRERGGVEQPVELVDVNRDERAVEQVAGIAADERVADEATGVADGLPETLAATFGLDPRPRTSRSCSLVAPPRLSAR